MVSSLNDSLSLPTINAQSYGNTGTAVSETVRDVAGEAQVLQRAVQQNEAAYANQRARTEQNAQRY
ncbi:MAG: hypothetical protein GDA49_13170 [Rhodospirillales bacterium]|nr:hypothetical protein [Rhodospirillales bacterium]